MDIELLINRQPEEDKYVSFYINEESEFKVDVVGYTLSEGAKVFLDEVERWNKDRRQSIYKLLVDEMPKEREWNQIEGREGSLKTKSYNECRTDCLAVIKRVLIGWGK